jgi:glycosyltransferase involved in cell wall biosynthesis
MIQQILFVLPVNELSGSVVSALRLKAALEGTVRWQVKLAAPEGDYLKPDIIIPECRKNPITLLQVYTDVFKHQSFYRFVIFFTIRFGMLAPILKRNHYLYIHEVEAGKGILPAIVKRIINYSHANVWVVNPKMKEVYRHSLCLPNVLPFEKVNNKGAQIFQFDFIMIANFKPEKGVFLFAELAKKLKNKRFILLTNEGLAENSTLDEFIQKAPQNLTIETSQDKKKELIRSSKYLLNLSVLEETFGLTMIEAISLGTVALSFKNMGAEYCLPPDSLFLQEDFLVESLSEITSLVDKEFRKYVEFQQTHVEKNFSSKAVVATYEQLVVNG